MVRAHIFNCMHAEGEVPDIVLPAMPAWLAWNVAWFVTSVMTKFNRGFFDFDLWPVR